jgi:MYXO-CTERM domain-containing protein
MGSRLKLVAFAAVLACEPATQSAGGDGGSPLALIGELASSDPAVGASLERARRATPSDPLALGEASSHLSRPVGPSLRMKLGSRSEDATLVRLGADELAFTRTGVAATSARVEGAVVAYDAPTGPDVVTFPLGSSIEELFVLRAEGDRVGYDLSLPPGWAPRASDGRRVVLGDGEGDRIAIEAPRAWQLDGSPVELAVELRGLHLDFEVLGEPTYPVVIDPIWSPAVQPIKLRKNHTATLLGDGRVLLVGGTLVDTSDTSTELFDTAAGASELGPALATARAQHTATLLRDGRVLVAGGNDSSPGTELASVELFDPAVGTLEAGPDMAVPRAGHSATLLDDGRVLFVGGGSAELFDPSTTTFTQVGPVAVGGPSAALLSDGRVFILGVDTSGAVAFLFDPAVDTLTPIPPPASVDYDPGSASLTVLRDGRVVIHGACPCFSIGGPIFSDDRVFVWNPVTSTYSVAGSLQDGRIGHTANLLPDGRVIFLGGSYSSSADLFDPQAGTFTRIADALLQQRETHTSTVLPNGNVLVVGGDQASAELFHGGAPLSTNAFVPGPALGTGRRDHTATTLSDGRVLLAGGDLGPTPTPSDSELFDESLGSFASGAAMVQPRARHSATRLNDGRVLVVGGRADFTTILAAVEWFDATSETFVAGPSLATARIEHTATRLRDGRVLVAGGFDGTTELDSAELFDPVTNTFAPVGPLPLPLSGHRAILLRSGKVLLLGVGVAVLFDPEAETFALASAPGAARTGATLTTLANGRVLVSGGDTLATELFDPQTETFSFSQAASIARFDVVPGLLPTGEVVLTGGFFFAGFTRVSSNAVEILDPAIEPTGDLFGATALPSPLLSHSVSQLRSGSLLAAGGSPCADLCNDFPRTESYLFASPKPPTGPVLTDAPQVIEPGVPVALQGLRFRGAQASSGRTNDSPSNHPLFIWQPLDGGATLVGRTIAFDDTSATWVAPATTFTGLGWLRAVVSGTVSDGRVVEIRPAGPGVGCEFDAECETGSCADGVCCDTSCDGDCEACSAEKKGSGVDGVCGPVPPGLFDDDACEVSTGAPCTEDSACESGFCEDGVCCQSACSLQCEACDVEGSVGTCVPVTGAPRAGRPACDTDDTDPCASAICDGTTREECAGTVGPCGEYACGETECLTSCEDDADCATGFHCEEGACVAGQCDGALATTPEGEQIDCSPYLCRPDGTCRTACSDVSDCAPPSACNFDGECVPRPPADLPSSCDCATVRPGSRGWAWAPLGILVALALRRRRHLGGGPSRWLLAAASCIAPVQETLAQPTVGAEPTPPPAEASTGDKDEAKKRFERGLSLVTERAWDAALSEFNESVRLFPTRGARQNAAFCLRELGRHDEALGEYEALLRDYPDMDEKKKTEAQEAISALRGVVGSIEVDAAEPGAVIVIDGRQRGTYPSPAPLRVPSGSHVVRVYKKGFVPFETRVDVASRQTARVEAKLLLLTESGTLKIAEKTGKKLKVFVDRVEVGETPFDGPLAVGEHVVTLVGEDGEGVAPTIAPVERDRVTALELLAVPLDAALRIEPSPAGALVAVDGVPLGRGTWEGPLPSGGHVVTVTLDGFLGQKRDIELTKGEPTTLRLTLEQNPDDERWAIPGKFVLEVTGGLNVLPSFFGTPMNDCAEECSAPVGLGGHALLHVSYEFGIGVALGLSGGWFSTSQSVSSRTARVQPVGLPARAGLVDDELSLGGGLVGAHVAYRFGEVVPVTLRLVAGALLARSSDTRTGRFKLEDGFTYQAGPVVLSDFSPGIVVMPEVRAAYPFTTAFSLSLGVAPFLVIPLGVPRWEPGREVDAAVDGIGAFGGEDLTGPIWFTVSPSAGARYAF